MTLRAFAAMAATLTAVAVLALTAPLPVTAQSLPPAPGGATPVNEAEIKSFATAVVEVKRVADSYLPVLAQAQTTQEKARVEDAAFAEIRQIVENEGLPVWRFNQILAMAHVSPDLLDQIRRHLPQ